MNKLELVSAVAEKAGMTKKDTMAIVENVVEVITETLCEKEAVKIAGLGTFTVKEREARERRNPATGETVMVDADVKPVFKVSKTLKDAINA